VPLSPKLRVLAPLVLAGCHPFAVPGLAPLVVKPSSRLVAEPTTCGFDDDFVLANQPPAADSSKLCGTPPTKMCGAADLHNHQFSNIGFGGRVLWGKSFDPDGIDSALSVCGSEDLCADNRELWACRTACFFAPNPASCRDGCEEVKCTSSPPHGHLGVTDPMGAALGQGIGHRSRGYPSFEGWPHYNSYTHQQEYYTWLKRAVQGGLKLIVMHALSNEVLCKYLGHDHACDDMANADLQLREARKLQCFVDFQNDCHYNNNGWYQVADSPAQARNIIQRGGLAVVLGLEVDSLFNCRVGQCTHDSVEHDLQRYRGLGVRHLFPIHLFDNAFGGTAVSRDFFNFGSAIVNHDLLHVRDCSDKQYEFHFGELTGKASALISSMSTFFGVAYPRYPKAAAHCNETGLNPLGADLIGMLMKNGMLIDVDHMSVLARATTLEMAKVAEYPGLVSGHSGFMAQLHGHTKHEGQLTADEVKQLLERGGMVAPILHQGGRKELDAWKPTKDAPSAVTNDCSNSAKSFAQAYLYAVDATKQHAKGRAGVGFGSDLNGFAGMPAPRFGPYACGGDGEPQKAPVVYPFTPLHGSVTQLGRLQSGYRIFDINYDGFAQVGLFPDFIEELQKVGVSQQDLEPLFTAADDYIETWAAADKKAAFPPAPRRDYESDCRALMDEPPLP
jgi:microsomal dipeptidase-like Zn-dependent dipeptidase